MEKKKIIIILSAVIVPYIIFSLLYNFDNKYTLTGEQPINGILDLRENSEDFSFLIYDWEYYPDNIYTPSDFSSGRPPSYMEYISIGERTSANRNSAFGKGSCEGYYLHYHTGRLYSLETFRRKGAGRR